VCVGTVVVGVAYILTPGILQLAALPPVGPKKTNNAKKTASSFRKVATMLSSLAFFICDPDMNSEVWPRKLHPAIGKA
jgi:hypothetical protein